MANRTMDTGTEELLCEVQDHIATITLNRPEKRNALSASLTPALRVLLLDVDADPDVRVVVITGEGKAFCAGGDVSAMSSRIEGRAGEDTARSLEDDIRTLYHGQEALSLRLYDLAKPTIAALPGAAAGAGMSLALACDLRVAAESAFLAPAFANVGLSGDYGGSWYLTRLIGSGKAKELYFTGRRVQSDEGCALGVFNVVVPDEQLQERTREMAAAIASGPPLAIRYMKQNLNRAALGDLKSCLAMEADRMIRCMRTQDHKEAVEAFLAKRRPQFQGR